MKCFQDARSLGYGYSLFRRIINNFKHSNTNPVRLLDKQYRMHPEICKFPNEQFYAGKLRSATFVYTKPLQNLRPFLMFSLNVFHSTKKQEAYRNNNETDFIYKLINALMHIIPRAVNVRIGIITPYQNQKAAIHNMLRSLT